MDNSPKQDTSTEEQNFEKLQSDKELSFDPNILENWDDNYLDQVQFEGFNANKRDNNISDPNINVTKPMDSIDLYGGINNYSQKSIFFDESNTTNLEEPSYLQEERKQSTTLLPKNDFDLSAITLADLSKENPLVIANVFDALESKDQASQIEFFNNLGLDLDNENDLKFIGKLNQIQSEQALEEGLNSIADNNSSLAAEDRLYTTSDTKLYTSFDAPDFNSSIEANPFEAVQVAEKTFFDFQSKSFISQPYYGLSLKGVSNENSLNFLSNRQYEIELLTNQNRAIREAKHELYNEVTAAPNTYFSSELSDEVKLQAYIRQLKNFCESRGLNADDADLKAKVISMDQWRVNDDYTSAVQQNVEIPYLEFNPKVFTKEILLLLESREHNNQLEAALLLKDHLGNDPENKTETTNKVDEKTQSIPKSTLNISGGPEDKEQIAANTIAAKSFKEIKQDELLERPPLAHENTRGYPRTIADELAAMSAKAAIAFAETIKKTIKLIIAALRALFNKKNEQEYQNQIANMKEIWNTPITSDINIRNNQVSEKENSPNVEKNGLVEPEENREILNPVSQDTLLPLLNDPYTNKLNRERDGVDLDEFDKNIAKVFEIDGEQYIVVDVVSAVSVDGDQETDSTPYLKLVKEDDLPPLKDGSTTPTPITPMYLESIEDKVKYLSISELQEGIKHNRVHEFEGKHFEPLCTQYLEQARMFLGADTAYGQDPSQLSEESKLSYKEQFAIKAYQSGQMISDQLQTLKSKVSNIFNKIKPSNSTESESSNSHTYEPTGKIDEIYIKRDSELEAFFKVRHDNVSYAEVEQYIGMVYKDEKTNELKAVLDIFSENLDKRAIVVPYELVNDIDQITEKDILYAEYLVNNSELIHLYELEDIEPIENLSIKKQFSVEYLNKLKEETMNNSSSQTNTYPKKTQRDQEMSKMELDGKLSMVGALVKTEQGQYVVLASDSEGSNSTSPEYKVVPITHTEHQITTDDILNNGIETIGRKDILEWHTFISHNAENTNQVSYLDPEVHEAISLAIQENREMAFISSLENKKTFESINSVGSKLITKHGAEYIGLFVKPLDSGSEYYAVKAPINQFGPVGEVYIQEAGVDIIKYDDIAQYQHSNFNQQQLLKHDVYIALVNGVKNENEHEVLHILSNLGGQENTEMYEKNQFLNQVEKDVEVKQNHLKAINELANQIDNNQLKLVVMDAATSLTDPLNSKYEFIADGMIELNKRLDTLQQDLILQANQFLQIEEYKALYDNTNEYMVLPTVYGDAKFVDLNSNSPEIAQAKEHENMHELIYQINSTVAQTGEVEHGLQHAKQEIITDHYLAAIQEDVKLHKLSAEDLEILKDVNKHIDSEFQLTGERLEALQPAFNQNTSNYIDSINNEKSFVSEVLEDFNSSLDRELERRNDRSNDQTLG